MQVLVPIPTVTNIIQILLDTQPSVLKANTRRERNLPDRLSLDPVLDVSDNDSSLLLNPDVLSDSDELRI